ncbi:MAG: B12-binding domain-containing radical SAM protein [Thermodesulfobacteriota bacterium]
MSSSDRLRVLCVNPWIHDFAAYNYWAAPLGLLVIAAMLRNAGADVSFFDCLGTRPQQRERWARPHDGWGCGPYEKAPIPAPAGLANVPRRFCRYGVSPERFRSFLREAEQPDCVLVTSSMTYWYPGVFEAIALVREAFPKVPVALGGAYAALCTEHAEKLSGADRVFSEKSLESFFSWLEKKFGFAPETKTEELCFARWPPPATDLIERRFVPALTGLGCPYACPYCASKLLQPGFVRKEPEAAARAIAGLCRRHSLSDVAFYDDALLTDANHHALPLLETLGSLAPGLRFHTPNAVHAREITPRVAHALFRAGFTTLRLGVETDRQGQNGLLDKKLYREEFEDAARSLLAAGFHQKNAGAYLLWGLPGQDVEEALAAVIMVKQAGLKPVLALYTPIPHTALWEAACKSSRYDLAADPVFTNNAVFPCREQGFSFREIHLLRQAIQAD